jgi:hypothetical protein
MARASAGVKAWAAAERKIAAKMRRLRVNMKNL